MAKKTLETRWGRVPDTELPLRPTLLNVSDATRGRVIRYLMNQAQGNPPVLAWVLQRSCDYWAAHKYPDDVASTEALHQRIDATVAVELLAWQADVKGPKEAVDWLTMVDELAGAPAKKEVAA